MIEDRDFTLYKQDARGKIRSWNISNDGYEITRESGLIDGDKTYTEDWIDEGKAGRTVQEQIDLFMNSKINKQIDKGYVYDLEEAKANKPTNALGLIRPMLAKRIDRVNHQENDYTNAILQRKYDGYKNMNTMVDGLPFAYSKNGKPLDAIKEIKEELSFIRMDGSVTLDGELYLHGYSLQKIGSFAKKRQTETEKLKFICYDIAGSVAGNEGYHIRNMILRELIEKRNLKHVEVAVSLPCDDFSLPNLFRIRDEQRALGYEGLIVRLDGTGYESGIRSANLLKVKKFIDAEFLVVGMTASKEGWAILHCIAANGKVFKMSAPGTHQEKRECLENLEHYVGRHITGKYANLTDDGVPFHPIAKNWKETE